MEFSRPASTEEAAAIKAADPGATILAGGTDLMVEVNFGHASPDHVIGLRRVDDLADYQDTRIGAGVTWARLEECSHRALAQAARTVGSPQIRAAGTIGGNIGTASPAGDGLPWLAAAEAEIEVYSTTRGTRLVSWDQFFTGVKQNALADDEVITAAVLPENVPSVQEFAKIGQRSAMVISTVSACVMRDDEGSIRVALGAVAPTPIRVRQAEALVSGQSNPSEALLEEFARTVSAEVKPITDHRSTEAYRRHASGVLARRLLERCLAQ
ncbi:MAG: FAD binding domain-containing protein [Acidimicrobiia bacterium]|nr:FAD binding domain-containing protein [Acidimicrobiia bacterium]